MNVLPDTPIRSLSVNNRKARAMTDFKGKPHGNLGRMSLATDGKYLYFTWVEDFGNIWVMDVAWE
jgi:hypothetical protein